MLRFFVTLFAMLSAQPVQAAKFANQFVEFELPSEWICLLEGAEWVCQNQQNAEKKKDAIVILAAKIQGDQDNLTQYLEYLKNPKPFTTPQGKTVTSEVRYAQTKTIQDHSWVDSLHLESEIPGFYTRYLATIKDGIGILVTYSVNKNKYPEYTAMFDNMVKSLKAFRREGGLNAAPATSDLFNSKKIPSAMTNDSVFPNTNQGASDAPRKQSAPIDDTLFYGGVALAAVVAILILKKVRGGKK